MFFVLFGTVGCNEDLQAPEPVAEISAADAVLQLKADFRKENDALAFHLRLNNGNFQDQALVRGYLASQFGESSSAISSFERTLATNNGAAMRTEIEENSLTQDAQNQIQNYINAADGYDEPSGYIAFLEGEFNSYLSSDLENPTNLGVALWLALQTETVDFVVENLELLVDTSASSNARIDHHWWEDVKEWWGENKKCVAGMVGDAGIGAIEGCGVGVALVATGAAAAAATVVGAPAAGITVGGACGLGIAIGGFFGALQGYADHC